MERRVFLKGAAFATAAVLGNPLMGLGRKESMVVFHIAGSRFLKLAEAVREGDGLRLEQGSFHGSVCFHVKTMSGAQLGYVPKELVPQLEGQVIVEPVLSKVDRYAVPWKRYQVTVRIRS